MQIFFGQGGPGFTADSVTGEIFLQFVIGIVRHIADTAAVHDGGFLFFRQETMKFRVVAGGNNQGINGPFVSVNFDTAVLDDAQINLDQIFFVFIDFVTEMNTAAGHPGQGTAS